MGRHNRRSSVPQGLDGPNRYCPGSIDDPVFQNTVVIHDQYYQAMREHFSHCWARRTLEQETARSRNAFRALGAITAKNKWDPVHFVRTAITMVKLNHNYISPESLLYPPLLDAYAQQVSKAVVFTANDDWQYYSRQLLNSLDPDSGATEYDLLWSPATCFPAWFRLLYPETLSDALFDLYGARAHEEFVGNPHLRALAQAKAPKTWAALQERWGKFADQGGAK